MSIWNPWHGCQKISPGCANCYVYRRDAQYGGDSTKVFRTKDFSLPMKRGRGGTLSLQAKGDYVFTCMTSDFFLEAADDWRSDIWDMIRFRTDLHFFIITKRITRMAQCLPPDWGDGYAHVTIGCTVETQNMANIRLPVFFSLPIQHRHIICEPQLEELDLTPWLHAEQLEQVLAGGESGSAARICRWSWIQSLAAQCRQADVSFFFKQTGSLFEKDGQCYRIPRSQQHTQAQKGQLALNAQILK